ncbi:MAG: YafY family transcriptional regulator [Anaerolineae bacterium]|nr:YafY family transcriptional regulator [Anaerolineae bacterium]
MSTTASRLITLIMLLQRKPKQKAADLVEQLGVSVRTVHRYIDQLNEMGIPVYSERGPYGGFSLVRGYKMPPLVFTPQEAVAVYLGTSLVEEIWGSLYADAARGVTAKLDNVLPDEQRQEVAWARRTLVVTGMQRTDHTSLGPALEKLRQAARQRRRVTMVYHSRNRPEPLERDVEPYALVHRWGWWYVIGHCCLRDALRVFRVDRIQELALRRDTYDVPEDFDVHQYLAEAEWFPPRFEVRMRFSPQAALDAQEEGRSWDTMEERPDGSLVVTFGATDLAWAARVALWYGPDVEVLEPVELRQRMKELATAIAARYRESKKDDAP